MDKALNAWIRELCREMMDLDERIDGVFRLFSHVERIENDRVAERVYVGECAGICSVGKPRSRSIDIMKVCLKERGLDVWMSGKQGVWCMIGVYGRVM